MSLAQQIAKEVVKTTGNARNLGLGDQVLHTPSKIHGTVVEIATVGSETVVSIRTSTGRILSKLNRKEFVLDRFTPTPHLDFDAVNSEPLAGIEGPISEESILDQLA